MPEWELDVSVTAMTQAPPSRPQIRVERLPKFARPSNCDERQEYRWRPPPHERVNSDTPMEPEVEPSHGGASRDDRMADGWIGVGC